MSKKTHNLTQGPSTWWGGHKNPKSQNQSRTTRNSKRQQHKTLPHSSNEVRMNRGAMGVTRQKTEGGKKA